MPPLDRDGTKDSSRILYISKYEVTQSQYRMLSGKSRLKAGDRLPLNCRLDSTTTVRSFCTQLTERERIAGRLPKGLAYRIPTNREWVPYWIVGDNYKKDDGSLGWLYSPLGFRSLGSRREMLFDDYGRHKQLGVMRGLPKSIWRDAKETVGFRVALTTDADPWRIPDEPLPYEESIRSSRSTEPANAKKPPTGTSKELEVIARLGRRTPKG